MKIMLLNQHPYDYLGGSEIQCDIIAKILTNFGHSVTYLATDGKKHDYYCKYKVIPSNLHLKNLYAIIRVEKPDIIYWRYGMTKFFRSALLMKILRIPLIFAISDNNDTRPLIINSLRRKPTKSKTFIITSLKSVIRPFVNIGKSLMHFINYFGFYFTNGVTALSNDLLNRVPVKRQILIRDAIEEEAVEFDWPRPFIVWVANLKPRKNPEMYINLAEECKRFDVDFLMIGHIQSPNYNFIKNKANLPKNLYYLGPKSPAEVNGIIKQSLFLVHTCNTEGFGDNFIQAWLQGKPTLSLYFDPDGLICWNYIGYLSKSIEQLVLDVNRLIDNDQLRLEMGDRAKVFAKNMFQPIKAIKDLESFLKTFIKPSSAQ